MNADTDKIRQMLKQGLCCSQVIVGLGLSLRGEENESMVTAATGLCMGLHSGRICGALSGACLVLSLFDPKNAARYMIPQLMEWYDDTFGDRYGGPDCQEICGGSVDPQRCTEIIVETWKQVRELLAEYGFDVEE